MWSEGRVGWGGTMGCKGGGLICRALPLDIAAQKRCPTPRAFSGLSSLCGVQDRKISCRYNAEV